MAIVNRKALSKEYKGNKPFHVVRKGGPYRKYDLRYYKFEAPKSHTLFDFIKGRKIEINDELVFGIKATPEDFTKYDFLNCWDGPGIIVHKRILKLLQEFCPGDFKAIPMVIKNYDAKDKFFENRDYVLLNILNELDVLDEEKTEFTRLDPRDEYQYIHKCVFKPNSMQGHHIGIIKDDVIYIISSELAYKLKDCTGIEFRVDWDSD